MITVDDKREGLVFVGLHKQKRKGNDLMD